MDYPELASIHITALHCKADKIPLPEKAIRRFVKSEDIPAVQTGKKVLIYYPNILEFVKHGNNQKYEQLEQIGRIRQLHA